MQMIEQYWEQRIEDVHKGLDFAQNQLGRLALRAMEQLTLPVEEFDGFEGWDE